MMKDGVKTYCPEHNTMMPPFVSSIRQKVERQKVDMPPSLSSLQIGYVTNIDCTRS